jgi:hypothetical protein
MSVCQHSVVHRSMGTGAHGSDRSSHSPQAAATLARFRHTQHDNNARAAAQTRTRSNACTPAMVVPPGEHTASLSAPGCWPVEVTMAADPFTTWQASCMARARGRPATVDGTAAATPAKWNHSRYSACCAGAVRLRTTRQDSDCAANVCSAVAGRRWLTCTHASVCQRFNGHEHKRWAAASESCDGCSIKGQGLGGPFCQHKMAHITQASDTRRRSRLTIHLALGDLHTVPK